MKKLMVVLFAVVLGFAFLSSPSISEARGGVVDPTEGIMADIMEDIVGGTMEDTTADIQDIMAGATTRAISHIIGDIR